MACKINNRFVLKSIALGFLLMGLILLSYSQVAYVDEKLADKNEGCN